MRLTCINTFKIFSTVSIQHSVSNMELLAIYLMFVFSLLNDLIYALSVIFINTKLKHSF